MSNPTLAKLRERAQTAKEDLAWHEARLPSPMTPKQFQALLDELCEVDCCHRRTRQGELSYTISISEIHEGDLLLSGECRPHCDPLRTAILRAIGQFHSIDISLERMSKSAPPQVSQEIKVMREANRGATAALNSRLGENETEI